MLPLTSMKCRCLYPEDPQVWEAQYQWRACQLKPRLLIALAVTHKFYFTPSLDGRDECEQVHNNSTTVSVLKGVPTLTQAILKGSLETSRHKENTQRVYLSFSLGESTPSSSSSLSSFAPISRCRAKSSKMMSSSLETSSNTKPSQFFPQKHIWVVY